MNPCGKTARKVSHIHKILLSCSGKRRRRSLSVAATLLRSATAVSFFKYMPTLQEQFGAIDIYLFDQILRGNIHPRMRVLDAGCGAGRNLVYLHREGYEIFASDQNPAALEQARALLCNLPADNLRLEAIENIAYSDASFDLILCSAVLHFSRDDAHFYAMVENLWRMLKPNGLFFCRLASTLGMAPQHITGHRLPA